MVRRLNREGAFRAATQSPPLQFGLIGSSSARPTICWRAGTTADAPLESSVRRRCRGLALLMLDGQAVYPCVEVWDRARLVAQCAGASTVDE
jgi:hypothetical protein